MRPEDEELRRLRRELADIREERGILNSLGHLLKTPEMKYQFIDQFSPAFRVKNMGE